MMTLKETSGNLLEVGDRVKMNIKAIGEGDLDGVEYTASGFNYWRYMNEHPDEIYTVEGIDLSGSDPLYILSGAMCNNTWYSDELILVPTPGSIFEVIKNMTIEEMSKELFPMVLRQCKGGVPSPELVEIWLNSKPKTNSEQVEAQNAEDI